jgi:hypothetical protein
MANILTTMEYAKSLFFNQLIALLASILTALKDVSHAHLDVGPVRALQYVLPALLPDLQFKTMYALPLVETV